MESQDIINGAIGLIGILGGWIMNNIWVAVKDLQSADKAIADKVAAIEVLVAGQYVKRDAFERFTDAIFSKLDKIEDKIDGKADKADSRMHA